MKGANGTERPAMVWPNAGEPENLQASTDLMLLHPDGREEVLVEGGKGAIADPYVSFDAQWVYYSYFHDVSGRNGDARYDLICGQGRLEAYVELGQTEIPAIVVEGTKEDLMLMSLAEQLYQAAQTYGFTEEQVTAQFAAAKGEGGRRPIDLAQPGWGSLSAV